MSALGVAPPLRVKITGAFWDSQVYSGNMHLFARSGEIVSFSWRQFVTDLRIQEELRFAADAALMGNRSFYGDERQRLIGNPEVRDDLVRAFIELELLNEQLIRQVPKHAVIRENRFPFPHNDSEIHYQQLYIGSAEGLFGATPTGRREPVRYTDAPALDIAASFNIIAQACGQAGLLQVRVGPLGERAEHPAPERLSTIPCFACEWAYDSVVASGYENKLYVASFSHVKASAETRGRSNEPAHRRFEGVITAEDVFRAVPSGETAVLWGARDKLFRYHADRIEVLRYIPSEYGDRFKFIGDIPVKAGQLQGEVVAARAAPFGSVIEYDEGLLVVPTSGAPLVLKEEPVSWRVFPRSVDYANHLHVIYEDRLEVFAFTHDYFVDQDEKLAGIRVGRSRDT